MGLREFRTTEFLSSGQGLIVPGSKSAGDASNSKRPQPLTNTDEQHAQKPAVQQPSELVSGPSARPPVGDSQGKLAYEVAIVSSFVN
jgi:hypothetical protein